VASLGGTINEIVQQGPFVVEDTGLGPLVSNDGSLWSNSAQYIGINMFFAMRLK
jgi:hypothetical protein